MYRGEAPLSARPFGGIRLSTTISMSHASTKTVAVFSRKSWRVLSIYAVTKNRYPQNRLITEFTHLFVDIKHMRPVTEVPVADLTFWFNEGSIYL